MRCRKNTILRFSTQQTYTEMSLVFNNDGESKRLGILELHRVGATCEVGQQEKEERRGYRGCFNMIPISQSGFAFQRTHYLVFGIGWTLGIWDLPGERASYGGLHITGMVDKVALVRGDAGVSE